MSDIKAKRYYTWRTFVMKWQPSVGQGDNIDIPLLKLVALAIADHGDWGMGSFVSDTVLADWMARDRRTLKRYREFLIGCNVVVLSGEHHGRVQDLDIGDTTGIIARPASAGDVTPVNRRCHTGEHLMSHRCSTNKLIPSSDQADELPFGAAADAEVQERKHDPWGIDTDAEENVASDRSSSSTQNEAALAVPDSSADAELPLPMQELSSAVDLDEFKRHQHATRERNREARERSERAERPVSWREKF